MRNFPDFLDGYLRYTDHHESTKRVRLWSAISVIAACLERKVWIDRGYYKLFPNLYVFIIGRSGLIKKTTSTGIAVNLLREVEGVRIMAERLTAGALVEQLALSGKKLNIDGKMTAQSAVFAYAPELSVFLTEVFGSVTELLTTFYDCVPHDASKPWVYHTIGRGERKIFGPCLNILGASTKSWLTKCIPRSEMEGGFTSRIVFVVEDKLPEILIPWPALSEEDDLTRLKLIEDLRTINTLSGPVTPSPEARALFTKWYENHMRKVLPYNQDPRMIGYMSRKGDTILKVSMIRSLSQRNDLLISKADLVWANEQIDDLEKDWRLAFDGLGSKSSLTFEIMEYIRKKTMVRKTELLQSFGQLYPLAEILKCIRELKNMDEITDAANEKDGIRHEYYAVPGWEEMLEVDGMRIA